MAKDSNKEAKEEGEISDDELDENATKTSNMPTPLSIESQPLIATAPTQFIGRSNRPKPKIGSAKFLRGSKGSNEPRNSYGKRLPSPTRVLPSLMQLNVHPSKDLVQNLPKDSRLNLSQPASNHMTNPERHGTERMKNTPAKNTSNENFPTQSPGALLWVRRRLRSHQEDRGKLNKSDDQQHDQDFGLLLEKYKQIQCQLADIRKEEETVLLKQEEKKALGDNDTNSVKGKKVSGIKGDKEQGPGGDCNDHWTIQLALSPPVSGTSSPILIDDEGGSPLFTIVDEVGEKTERDSENEAENKTSPANSDDEELDELELRRIALASAMSRAEESSQLTDESSSQEPRMASESPDRNQLTHRSKVDEGSRSRSYGNQALRHPVTREPARRRHYSQEGRDLKSRQAARNRAPVNRSHYMTRQSSSDHKVYEAKRRTSASRDYDYHRRDDFRKREEEERRQKPAEIDRKKDKEGSETQTREIQRILTMIDDPKEQVAQFLELINKKSANRDRTKSPLPIFKKSSDISASVREKATEQPLQDNYEEVEMDIDSEPDSPAVPAASTDDLFEADIYSAMKPVQPMAYDVPAVPNITPQQMAQYLPFWTPQAPPLQVFQPTEKILTAPTQPSGAVTLPVVDPPPPPPLPPQEPPPPKPPMPPPLPESPLPPLPDEPPPTSQPPLPAEPMTPQSSAAKVNAASNSDYYSQQQVSVSSGVKVNSSSLSGYSHQQSGVSFGVKGSGSSTNDYYQQEPIVSSYQTSTPSSAPSLSLQDRLQTLGATQGESHNFSSQNVNSSFSANQTSVLGSYPTQSIPYQQAQTVNFPNTTQTYPGQYSDNFYNQGYQQGQDGSQLVSQHDNQSHDKLSQAFYGAYTVSKSSAVTLSNTSRFSYGTICDEIDHNQSVISTNQNQLNVIPANQNQLTVMPASQNRVNNLKSDTVPSQSISSTTSAGHDEGLVPSHTEAAGTQDDDDDDEAEILRAQLLKSFELKRKKERVEEIKVESSSSRSQSPNLVSSNASEVKKRGQDRHKQRIHLGNLPVHRPVVIHLGDDSSEEEEEKAPEAQFSVDKFLGGIDDFLKEARRSAEAAPKLSTEVHDSLPPTSTQSVVRHTTVNQPASTQLRIDQTAAVQSAWNQPALSQPTSTHAASVHAATSQPTSSQPTLSQPTSVHAASANAATSQPISSQPLLSQATSHAASVHPISSQTASAQDLLDQQAINQAASEKWKKWKRERELKEQLKQFEEEIMKRSQTIVKDQSILKALVSRAGKYAESLKVSEVKVQKLTEQLTATQKIATANKEQLEKSRKQARTVKDRLLNRKKDYEDLQKCLLAAGRELYGEGYRPKVLAEVTSSIKRKVEPSQQALEVTLRQKNVILKDNIKITVNNQKRSPNKSTSAASKKLSTEEIVKEKQRLLQLEEVYANKIRQLKQTSVNSASDTAIENKENKVNVVVPVVKKEIPRLEKIALSTIDLTEENEIDDTPCKRRRSLMEINPSTKPNIEVRNLRLSRSSQSSISGDDDKIKVDFPEGKLLIKLHKLQRQRVDSVLQKHCQSVLPQDTAVTFQSLTPQVEQIGCLQAYKKPGSVKSASAYPPSASYKYTSPLLHFKSYRFSPYFRTKANKTLTSKTCANKLLPKKILCRFDLQGKCNDDNCRWQHENKYSMSEKEILQDIVAYCPAVAGVTGAMPAKEVNRLIGFYVDSQIKQNQGRLRIDEMCLLLISKVTEQAKHVRPHTMFYTTRPYRPKQIDRDVELDSKALEKRDQENFTFQKLISVNPKKLDSELGDQDMRYFFQNDSSDILGLETAVTEDPHDTHLWLKLAAKKLNNPNSSPEESLDQALNVLSRGIEENKHNSDLWYQYLSLYSKHRDSSDLTDFCQTAVECAPSFEIWWLYLHSVATYPDRNEICSEIIDYLCTRQTKNDLDLAISHHLLEVMLYKISLSVMAGRLQYATNILQGYFVKSEGKLSVQSYLTTCDKCVLWLSYVHLNLTGELPSQLYDPASQMSGKIVCKENLILPWHKLSAPESLLNQQLALLQEAVSVCITSQLGTNPRCLQEGLVLYQNIILLLQSQNKLEEMLSVCRDLLQQDPSLVDIWMIVANLYAANKEFNATQQVFADAKEVNMYSAKVFHYCANFEISQKESKKAVECLGQCSTGYFDTSEVDPLLIDPALCYSCILKQALPLGYTAPPLKHGVTEELIKQEKVYLWLNYCLYLELDGNNSQAIEMYETALSSVIKAEDICMVWLGYLEFQYRQLRASTENIFETKKFAELIHRCLLTMPSKFEIPYWPNQHWNNFAHVNKIIDWYLKVLVPEQRYVAFDRLVTLMPTNIPLVFRSCEECLKPGEDQKALSICYPLVFEDTQNLTLWKLIISLALKKGTHKEIRRMFHRAVQTLPYSTSLWKDFLTFELTQGRASRGVIVAVINHCQQLGLPMETLTENMPEITLLA